MSQVPAPPTGAIQPSGGLPRVQPISVIGVFICCFGYIWTIINYFKALGGINQINPSANLQAWTLFVPIYNGLYMSNVIKALNELSQQHNLPPLEDNIVLNLLLLPLPMYQVFTRYNQVADAIERK